MKNMILRTASVLALAASVQLFTGGAANAAASAEKSGDSITMQNDLLKLSIDLKKGARISEFLYKPFGGNIVYPVESAGGMLMDHVWEQTWPGEFLNRAYEGEVVKAGPDEASVKVSSMGIGDTIKGIKLERLITLKAGDHAVYCRLSLTNTSEQGKVTGYWIQNNFWFGGKKEGISWFRPTTRGIDRMGRDAKGDEWFGNSWYYIDDATAGWNGAASKELKQGVMFLMDYNDLWRIYDNAFAITTEWMYDRVAIPVGKTWNTEIVFYPVAGVTGFTHGSRNVAANFEISQEGDSLTIEHQVAKGLVPLKDVTVSTKVWGLKKPWELKMPDAKFANLTDAAQAAAVKAPGAGAMPAGIQVTLTGTAPDGKTITETYGDYYGGAEGKNNDPFTMKPYLAFERPPKRKVYLKPDVVEYKANAEPKILYLKGLWTNLFRVEEAVKAGLPTAKVADGWLDASPVGLTVTSFPADYPSLTSNDLYILGNMPAAPFGLVGQEMLKDYLAAGGNMLILGGDQAFGQADFSNNEFLDMLPVEVGGHYNWRKIEGGALKISDGSNPVAQGVSFGSSDKVFYSHLCKPKTDAKVVVTAGDRPILVLGTTPKGGRIACVLATTFGEPGAGDKAFWDSPAWQRLMQNTVQWLVIR